MGRKVYIVLFTLCSALLLSCLVTGLSVCVEKPTTADEYKQKHTEVKHITVKLPSGAVFKLRSIDRLAFYRLLRRLDISPAEYDDLMDKEFEDMTLEEIDKFTAFWDALVVECVESPKMCVEEEEGKLPVQMLTSDDMDKLREEIEKITSGIFVVSSKPVSATPTDSADPKLTITDLIRAPEMYEGKDIDIKGVVAKEMTDIDVRGGYQRGVSLQRFYISDDENSILVFRFYREGDKLNLRPVFFAKPGTKVKVRISGRFTTRLLNEPVIITHGRNIVKVQDSWIRIVQQAMKNYQQ